MAGKIDIVNMALNRLGLGTIGSLNDPLPQAQTAAAEFDNARDCVLRDFQWGFSERILAQAPLAAAAPDGWRCAYAYPPDCLLVRKATENGMEVPFKLGDVGGQTVILCDSGRAEFIYTIRVRVDERLDPLFVDALAWRLAVPLALGVSADQAKAQTANAMYEATLARARVQDAVEEDDPMERISRYEAGRL